jgi:hypothetical protein
MIQYINMKEQHFKNHAQMVPGFHYITLPLLLAVFIGSLINLFKCEEDDFLMASVLTLLAFTLFLLVWYTRIFPLKAQDRAIRAEENFRHFILTGKPLPSELRVSQIIALRFASDAEFPALVERAVSEKLSNKQIKESITNWRADYYRV